MTRGQRRKSAKRVLDPVFEEQILAGRVYAMVSFFSLLFLPPFVSCDCLFVDIFGELYDVSKHSSTYVPADKLVLVKHC